MTTTQVFGPDRPAAALRAISRLAELQDQVEAMCGFASDDLLKARNRAQDERERYPEYADAATAQART